MLQESLGGGGDSAASAKRAQAQAQKLLQLASVRPNALTLREYREGLEGSPVMKVLGFQLAGIAPGCSTHEVWKFIMEAVVTELGSSENTSTLAAAIPVLKQVPKPLVLGFLLSPEREPMNKLRSILTHEDVEVRCSAIETLSKLTDLLESWAFPTVSRRVSLAQATSMCRAVFILLAHPLQTFTRMRWAAQLANYLIAQCYLANRSNSGVPSSELKIELCVMLVKTFDWLSGVNCLSLFVRTTEALYLLDHEKDRRDLGFSRLSPRTNGSEVFRALFQALSSTTELPSSPRRETVELQISQLIALRVFRGLLLLKLGGSATTSPKAYLRSCEISENIVYYTGLLTAHFQSILASPELALRESLDFFQQELFPTMDQIASQSARLQILWIGVRLHRNYASHVPFDALARELQCETGRLFTAIWNDDDEMEGATFDNGLLGGASAEEIPGSGNTQVMLTSRHTDAITVTGSADPVSVRISHHHPQFGKEDVVTLDVSCCNLTTWALNDLEIQFRPLGGVGVVKCVDASKDLKLRMLRAGETVSVGTSGGCTSLPPFGVIKAQSSSGSIAMLTQTRWGSYVTATLTMSLESDSSWSGILEVRSAFENIREFKKWPKDTTRLFCGDHVQLCNAPVAPRETVQTSTPLIPAPMQQIDPPMTSAAPTFTPDVRSTTSFHKDVSVPMDRMSSFARSQPEQMRAPEATPAPDEQWGNFLSKMPLDRRGATGAALGDEDAEEERVYRPLLFQSTGYASSELFRDSYEMHSRLPTVSSTAPLLGVEAAATDSSENQKQRHAEELSGAVCKDEVRREPCIQVDKTRNVAQWAAYVANVSRYTGSIEIKLNVREQVNTSTLSELLSSLENSSTFQELQGVGTAWDMDRGANRVKINLEDEASSISEVDDGEVDQDAGYVLTYDTRLYGIDHDVTPATKDLVIDERNQSIWVECRSGGPCENVRLMEVTQDVDRLYLKLYRTWQLASSNFVPVPRAGDAPYFRLHFCAVSSPDILPDPNVWGLYQHVGTEISLDVAGNLIVDPSFCRLSFSWTTACKLIPLEKVASIHEVFVESCPNCELHECLLYYQMERRRYVLLLSGEMLPWSPTYSTKAPRYLLETKVCFRSSFCHSQLQRPNDVRFLAGTGWTALHAAAFQEHGKVVRLLLAHQADPKMVDAEGRRAVDYASISEATWPFFSGPPSHGSSLCNRLYFDVIYSLRPAQGCTKSLKSDLVAKGIIRKIPDRPEQIQPNDKYESVRLQEAKEQMHRWTTISKGMIGLVAVYTVYAIGDHLSHEHHEEETPAYPYLKMRTKPFPWPESDCDLLDRECRLPSLQHFASWLVKMADTLPIVPHSAAQRVPQLGEPVCVYVCDATDQDVCSLECRDLCLSRHETTLHHDALQAKRSDELRRKLGIKISDSETAERSHQWPIPFVDFAQQQGGVQLPKILSRNLSVNGFERPTPVQMQTIPCVLKGHNVSVFWMGYCSNLRDADNLLLPDTSECSYRNGKDSIIETVAKLLMRGIADMKTALLVGGFPVPTQRYRLQGGVQLIVATPGRFLDIFTNYSDGDAILPAIRLCVVDEVDIMLDVGFRPQITQIVALLAGERHKGIQLLFFSATVSDEVEALVRQVLKAQSDHSYTRIDVRSDENKGTSGYSLSPRVKHEVQWAENKAKKNELFEFLKGKGEESTVRAIVLTLCKLIGAAAIHADKTQQERLSLLESFVNLEIPVLVSTNVLSRGMDLLNVENVVVYDFPKKIADFVHLIGRTGRADDAPGKALTLVNLDDRLLFKELVTLLRQVKVSIPPEVFQSIHSEDAKKRARSIEVVVDESKRAFRIREQLMDEIGTQASDWKEWDSHNKRRPDSTTDDRDFGIGGDSETPDQTWTPQRKSSDPTEVKRHDTNHYCVAPHNSLEDDSILQSFVPNEEDAVHNYQVRQEQQSHHERCEAYTKSQLISYDGSESVQCERP
ncbi:P-loop containing nucleoside triphosphate hydrolase [Phytophthora cactorum]|nr:P-loop containing nucleoside triphosphate hydrolase [Phytophthora cactorum]